MYMIEEEREKQKTINTQINIDQMTPVCINSDHRLQYKLVYIFVYEQKKKDEEK